MRKKIIYIGLTLFCSSSFILGQNGFNPTKTIPELTTPNPDTYNLGRYGEVPMNLYNGTANIVVPLQTLNFEGLEIPINITYNTSAYRVNQEASWVGLGWTLSCEPVITRQMKGNSDIDKSGTMSGGVFRGYIYTDIALPEYGGDISPELVDALELYSYRHASSYGWDTEPDIFSINIFGESVSFIFMQKPLNNNEIGIKIINGDKRYKIVYDEKDQTFTVINEQGFKFYFTKKEYSIVAGNQGLDNYVAKQSSPQYITGWKLSKIISPNIRQLIFNYEHLVTQSLPMWSNSKYKGNTANIGGLFPPAMYGTEFNRSSHLLGYQSLVLQSISGDQFTVEFNTTDRLDITKLGVETLEITNIGTLIGYSDLKPQKLDNIIIKNNNSNSVKNYSLSYSYFNNDQIGKQSNANLKRLLRLKLDRIDLNNILYRKFSYSDSDKLPNKTSRHEDFWGYYNGSSGHSHMIYPSFKTSVIIGGKAINLSVDGDNRLPNYNYSKIGLLNRVTYPTGGYTSLEYEPHMINVDKTNYNEFLPLRYGTNKEIIIESQSSDYPQDSEFIEILEDSPINTIIEIRFGINGNYIIDQKQSHIKYSIEEKDSKKVAFELIDTKGNKIVEQTFPYPLDFDFNRNEDWNKITLSLKLPKGKYKATVKALKHISNFFDENDGAPYNHIDYGKQYNYMVKATIAIPMLSLAKQYNLEAGGVRIKSISNYDNNILLTRKEYKYVLDRSIGDNISSGILTQKLLFSDFKKLAIFEYLSLENINSHAVENLTVYSDNISESNSSQIGYSRVEELSLDNKNLANNGYVVSEFINIPDKHSELIAGGNFLSFKITDNIARRESLASIPSLSFSDINGKIKKEIYYDNQNKKIKETLYSYNYESTEMPNISHTNRIATGLKPYIYYNYEGHVGQHPYVSDATRPYIMQIYKIISENILSISKTETNYINGQALTQTTSYDYNKDYQPLLIQTSSSQPNINQETYYKYPSDFKVNSPYKEMVEQNILSPIIETKLKIDKSESIKRTNYSKINNMFLPAFEESSFGGSIRTDITYNNYDLFGNITQYTSLDGIGTVYLWSYNGQYPIAEIRNAMYADVSKTIDVEALSKKLQPSESDYNAIRALETSLKNALITTYTYKPLVGMTSMTDPRGVVTTYEYDAFGRLAKVKDANGKVINSYDYHYQNQ